MRWMEIWKIITGKIRPREMSTPRVDEELNKLHNSVETEKRALERSHEIRDREEEAHRDLRSSLIELTRRLESE